MCSDPAMTVGAIDTCGCCDGQCPQPCGCSCTTDQGTDGVRVLIDLATVGLPLQMEQCLNASVAITAVDAVEAMSCIENCDAPPQNPFPFP